MIGIGAIIGLLVCAGLLPLSVRLFVAVPLSVFQLYIPGLAINSTPLPLSLLATFTLWPEAVRGVPRVSQWRISIPLLGVLVGYLLSILWSPDQRLGITTTIYLMSFLVIFAAAIPTDRTILIRNLNITLWFGLLEVILVIIFRLDPTLKLLFLQSRIASWFISENILNVLFSTGANNVLSAGKSGGLFVNANVGAAYMAILLFSWLALRHRQVGDAKLHAPYIVLLAYVLGISFTGSKAASILMVVSYCVYTAYAAHIFQSSRKIGRYGILFAPLIVVAAFVIYNALQLSTGFHTFTEQSADTLSARTQIWSYGVHAFIHNPIIGQGFGGWQHGFEKYAIAHGLDPDYPPHNTFMYLWSQGGLISLISGILFVVRLMWLLLRRLSAARHRIKEGDSAVFLATLLAFGWTFVHGMGTNFGLIGEAHMAPLLAVLLGIAYQTSRRRAHQEDGLVYAKIANASGVATE